MTGIVRDAQWQPVREIIMFDRGVPGVTLYELDRALKAVEPAVMLVPPRIMRRIIRSAQSDRNLGLIIPHRKAYLIDGPRLLTFADRDELGLRATEEPPALAILLELPTPEKLAETPRRRLMLRYWRLLFHCEVH